MRERKAYLKVTFPFQSSEIDETVDPKYQVFYVDVDTGHGQFKVKKRKIDFDFFKISVGDCALKLKAAYPASDAGMDRAEIDSMLQGWFKEFLERDFGKSIAKVTYSFFRVQPPKVVENGVELFTEYIKDDSILERKSRDPSLLHKVGDLKMMQDVEKEDEENPGEKSIVSEWTDVFSVLSHDLFIYESEEKFLFNQAYLCRVPLDTFWVSDTSQDTRSHSDNFEFMIATRLQVSMFRGKHADDRSSWFECLQMLCHL